MGREEKYVRGREENIWKDPGEGFNNVIVLKTFPSTLKMRGRGEKKGKGEEKRGKGEEKDAQGREKHIFKGAGEGFQQCYALKPSPAPWKIRRREEKRGRGEEKDAQEREENIFKVLGKVFNSIMCWKPSPAP